ncbi:MAG: hypothetical protein RLY61_171 [Candidatus Parcubacteria bacterium]
MPLPPILKQESIANLIPEPSPKDLGESLVKDFSPLIPDIKKLARNTGNLQPTGAHTVVVQHGEDTYTYMNSKFVTEMEETVEHLSVTCEAATGYFMFSVTTPYEDNPTMEILYASKGGASGLSYVKWSPDNHTGRITFSTNLPNSNRGDVLRKLNDGETIPQILANIQTDLEAVTGMDFVIPKTEDELIDFLNKHCLVYGNDVAGAATIRNFTRPKSRNEDRIGMTPKGGLVVCDGMGGLTQGGDAADITHNRLMTALKSIEETEGLKAAQIAQTIADVFHDIHSDLLSTNALKLAFAGNETLGTTATVMYPCPEEQVVVIVSIGDSCATIFDEHGNVTYRSESDNFTPPLTPTTPHPLIKRLQKALLQELASNVQAIEDDPSAADLLGERHKMTQALGIPCRTEDPENPAIYLHVDVVPFNPGDVCIVGTDGMYDVLTDADITRVRRVAVEQNSNPARLAGTLLMCAAGLSLGRTTQRTQKRDDITTGVYGVRNKSGA